MGEPRSQRQRKKRAYEASTATPPSTPPPAAATGSSAEVNSIDGSTAVGTCYEYLDHTADIQLHAWGATLQQAFANAVICMFNYMTDVEAVNVDESCTREINVEGGDQMICIGHDMSSLLYKFMDEFLFQFGSDGFVCCDVQVLDFDRQQFRARAVGKGERFSLAKHSQGTEIKAITFSNMQVIEHSPDDARFPGDRACEVYVIIDI